MKKLFPILFLSLSLYASNMFSQSNLTWTFKDKFDKEAHAEKITSLNIMVDGFENNGDAAAFCEKLKSEPDFASFDVVSTSKNSCNIKFTMKQGKGNEYYINLAEKMNIKYIVFNDEKKPVADWRKKRH